MVEVEQDNSAIMIANMKPNNRKVTRNPRTNSIMNNSLDILIYVKKKQLLGSLFPGSIDTNMYPTQVKCEAN